MVKGKEQEASRTSELQPHPELQAGWEFGFSIKRTIEEEEEICWPADELFQTGMMTFDCQLTGSKQKRQQVDRLSIQQDSLVRRLIQVFDFLREKNLLYVLNRADRSAILGVKLYWMSSVFKSFVSTWGSARNNGISGKFALSDFALRRHYYKHAP